MILRRRWAYLYCCDCRVVRCCEDNSAVQVSLNPPPDSPLCGQYVNIELFLHTRHDSRICLDEVEHVRLGSMEYIVQKGFVQDRKIEGWLELRRHNTIQVIHIRRMAVLKSLGVP